jgi:hypothetical protein
MLEFLQTFFVVIISIIGVMFAITFLVGIIVNPVEENKPEITEKIPSNRESIDIKV